MKKILIILCFIFCFISSSAYAMEASCSAGVLMEADTKEIIWSKNENDRLPIASTTKIMTAILAIENSELSNIFEVSEYAQNQEGSSIYLRKGNKITLENLLYGLMLNSGNDAAVVIAEGVGGTEENFVNMMNEKAMELGCVNTCFKNPNGLNEDGHYSSAYDMALIMSYAMGNDIFKEIVSCKRYNIENLNSITYLKNHNKLLWQYENCIGGKTGYTKLSGRCLVTESERDGVRLTAVTLNCPNDWTEHKNMFDYGFSKIKNNKIIEKNEIITTKRINGTKINLLSTNDFYVPMSSSHKKNIKCKLHLNQKIKKIEIGTLIGYADIYYKNIKVGSIDLKCGQNAKKRHKINIFFKNNIDFNQYKCG